jgi:MFS family permease
MIAMSTGMFAVRCALAGMGAAVFVTALFGRIWSTAAGMLGLGFFAAFIFVTSQTLMQQETPQEMLGRVTSSLMSLMAVSQVLAMFVAGPVAQKAGIRNRHLPCGLALAPQAARRRSGRLTTFV